jgi:hypothetical protein
MSKQWQWQQRIRLVIGDWSRLDSPCKRKKKTRTASTLRGQISWLKSVIETKDGDGKRKKSHSRTIEDENDPDFIFFVLLFGGGSNLVYTAYLLGQPQLFPRPSEVEQLGSCLEYRVLINSIFASSHPCWPAALYANSVKDSKPLHCQIN